MAKNLSADNAVSVKIDTPMDMSLAVSEILQISSPHGHDSMVYTIDVKGTLVIRTRRSANANERIYLKKKQILNT